MLKLLDMALYKTIGVVLGSRTFDETAKLVSFFTRDHGKITVIAKGAKRTTSKFGGRLETFCYGELLLVKGRSLDILSQIEVIESFQPIREDPSRLNLAFYFLRVVREATLSGHKNPRLFALLLASLKKIADGESHGYIVKFFETNFIKIEGLFRRDQTAEETITEHLEKNVRSWKNQILIQDS